MKNLKRVLALTLSVLMILGCLTACGGGDAQETEPVATEDPEEAKTLKVLTIGHSLSNDANWLLPLVADAEGYENLTVGFLYFSGCPLYKHVNFMNSNAAEYKLWLTSTDTANEAPKCIEDATMLQAVEYDYWDIIVMQGGSFEIAEDATYTSGAIQLIQKFVNEHKKNPNAVFMWHTPWAFATEEALQMTKDADLTTNSFYQGYKAYDNDRTKFYAAFSKCVENHILPDESFVNFIPTGTAFENAVSSYMTEFDMHRDYSHATDFARVIAAYTYFCVLTGVEQLEEIKLDAIPRALLNSTLDKTKDRVLTDNEKALILESVNNALKNPLQITKSQYTEAPADYIPAN